MDKIIERIKTILMAPKDAFTTMHSDEESSISKLLKEYYILIAGVPAGAVFLGLVFKGYNFFSSLVFGVLIYGSLIASAVIGGKIINALALSFGGSKDDLGAFKVAAYALTPLCVSGILLLILPFYPLFLIGSLYGVYILYHGLLTVMGITQDKALGFTAVAGVGLVFVLALFYNISIRLSGLY